VALRCNEKWLSRVWFLNNADVEFVVQVALQLEAMVFAIGETAPPGYLYIIHRGLALYGGRVLTAGSVWGEDMILTSEHLVRKYCARAMTFLEVYTISRDQLLDAAECHPVTRSYIQRCALRLATRREFIRIAHERAEAEADAAGTQLPGKKGALDRAFGAASSSQKSPGAAAMACLHHGASGGVDEGRLLRRASDTTCCTLKVVNALSNPSLPGTALSEVQPVVVGGATGTGGAEGSGVQADEVRVAERLQRARRSSAGLGTNSPTPGSLAASSPSATAEATLHHVEAPPEQAALAPSGALAAQLARLEKQQAEMAEAIASLRSGMEVLLRAAGPAKPEPTEETTARARAGSIGIAPELLQKHSLNLPSKPDGSRPRSASIGIVLDL